MNLPAATTGNNSSSVLYTYESNCMEYNPYPLYVLPHDAECILAYGDPVCNTLDILGNINAPSSVPISETFVFNKI